MVCNKYSVYNQVHDLIQTAFDLNDCIAGPEIEISDREAVWAVALVRRAEEDLEKIRLAFESALSESQKEI